MTILDNAADRLAWLQDAARIRTMLQRMEIAISIALATRPPLNTTQELLAADQRLGIAARAVLDAADIVRGLK